MSRPWAILAALVACAPAVAQQPGVRPTERTPECATSCHAEQQKGEFLHGPNAVKACDACHEYVDPARHTFKLKRAGEQLCSFCHIDKSAAEGPVVHAPFAKGECVSCHDPHGSNHRKMLKQDTVSELCVTCHKDTLKGQHVHGPVASDCTTCHRSHSAPMPRLLTLETRALCVTCHEKVGQGIAEGLHPHEPAKGDCLQCHTAHSTDHPSGLKMEAKDLCISCHKQIGEVISTATHRHSAVTDGKACLNCHTAHSSEHAKQLANDPITSCLECHKAPIKLDGTRTVAGVPELGVDSLHRHGPIVKGECGDCHNVHGSTLDRLLVRPYATTFNQPFNEEAYALCLGCHDRGALIGGSLTRQTGFRDGDRNLHAVHLLAEPQGRNCRACHSTHASKFKAQVAETVPFGQWSLPLNFKPTETGGSCAPGCHKVQKYDRVAPVNLSPVPAPTPPPAPAVKPGSKPGPTKPAPARPAAAPSQAGPGPAGTPP